MTEPKKRGPKRRYPSLTLIQMNVTPELREWFEALPGNSNHEKMRWLRERIGAMDNPICEHGYAAGKCPEICRNSAYQPH